MRSKKECKRGRKEGKCMKGGKTVGKEKGMKKTKEEVRKKRKEEGNNGGRNGKERQKL